MNCHCRFCRKAHGAPFATLLFMPFASLTVLAGAELVARHHVPNLNSDRCFCSKCGTRLYNHALAQGMVSLVVATLDVHLALQPIAHINTESKCDWFEIKDELPQFRSLPDPGFRQLLQSLSQPARA